METKSFDYISDNSARVLILGTMPGRASIEAGEYYGHPDNIFWDIIFRVCNPTWKCEELVSVNYKTKKETLLRNHIALWDVLKYCERQGSLDRNIRNQIQNDFNGFFQKHPSIETVFFNGKQASKYFNEISFEPTVFEGRKSVILQSTSPSNKPNPFFILKEWMQIRNFITL